MLKLTTELAKINGIGQKFLVNLEKLKIKTVKDLLWHFPFRYDDFSSVVKIADLKINQAATINGIVKKLSMRRSWRRKIAIVEALITDETGGIKAIWFNQPYIAKILQPGRRVNFAGKVVFSNDEIYLQSPAYELIGETTETKHTAGLIPIYSETRGLTSKGLRFLVGSALKIIEPIKDFIPEGILSEYDFPSLMAAIKNIHFPRVLAQAERARERFAFADLFLLQLTNLKNRYRLSQEKAPPLKIDVTWIEELRKKLPFALTAAQERSLREILDDLHRTQPMNRLLQGDVGSGKTVIAAIAALVAAKNDKQTAFMAPTEVLAKQHYKTLTSIFSSEGGSASGGKNLNVGVAILTSGEARVFHGDGLESKISRPKLLEEIQSGEIKLVIGTHALISGGKNKKSVQFRDLALAIVDEQHRFGVQQRAELVARGPAQTNTQTNADDGLLYGDLTYKIRGIAFEIKKKLGLGHKEVVYQRAFEEEFKRAGILFEKEKSIPVEYAGKKIGAYQPDFVVEDKVILELKAEPYSGRVSQKQLWNYLKGSNYKLGLLVNFGGGDIDIKRIVYETARVPRQSAFSQRESAVLPHFLSMSATPIPRTLSLTLFGDLDLSIIDELPQGRKEIITKIVAPIDRNKAYEFIREQIKKGRQAFVICPRIEAASNEPQSTNGSEARPVISSKQKLWAEVKNVTEEYERLSKNVFPDLRIAMLHGKLKSAEKGKIMSDFSTGQTNILVSTSVIEVGVDVPNATIMMIEGADRFGLAQLYQFRGRVGRGEHQSFCLLFTDSTAESTHDRLDALLKAKNGFELAEKDLAIRGPGEFIGDKQTGIPDLAMRALNNMELVRSARVAATGILKKDPELTSFPLLVSQLENFQKQIHLE